MNKRLFSVLVIITAILVSVYFMMLRTQEDADTHKDVRKSIESNENNMATEDPSIQPIEKQPPVVTEKELEPEIRKAIQELVNTSSEGLAEEQTNKGINVNLQGRFRTAPVATINEKGEVEIQDYTSPPGK